MGRTHTQTSHDVAAGYRLSSVPLVAGGAARHNVTPATADKSLHGRRSDGGIQPGEVGRLPLRVGAASAKHRNALMSDDAPLPKPWRGVLSCNPSAWCVRGRLAAAYRRAVERLYSFLLARVELAPTASRRVAWLLPRGSDARLDSQRRPLAVPAPYLGARQ